MQTEMREQALKRLIVALDVPTEEEALRLVDRLQGHVGWFKIGLGLFTAVGPGVVQRLVDRGASIFLDLKYHDIPNTVAAGVEAATRLGVGMLTLHTAGGRAMMTAAREAAERAAAAAGVKVPYLLGVTVLTSMDARALAEVGSAAPLVDTAVLRARLAEACKLHGVVSSPFEVQAVRAMTDRSFLVVTPGIRPAGNAPQDQARAATPSAAIQAGAHYLVVGRPIVAAADPVAVADRIVAEMAEAKAKLKNGVEGVTRR